MNTIYIRLCWWLVLLPVSLCQAQSGDSVSTLKKVTVSGLKKKSTFTAATPLQSLNSETLQQLNAPSVGDAARYFSGVLVKDWGCGRFENRFGAQPGRRAHRHPVRWHPGIGCAIGPG